MSKKRCCGHHRRSRSSDGFLAKTALQTSLLLFFVSLSRRKDCCKQGSFVSKSQKRGVTFLSVIFSTIVIAVMIASMFLSIAVLTTVEEQHKSILGYRIYLVRTDSMSLSENNADLDVHFDAGDIVFAQIVRDHSTLQAGDIISFISTNKESLGETVTHMIREVKTDADGNVVSYVTYGTNTNENDDGEVTPDRVLGKYVYKIPQAGNFFMWMKSPQGYIICVLVPLMMLLFYYGIHSIKHANED